MKYNYRSGVQKKKNYVKRFLAGSSAALVMTVLGAAPTFAANNYCGASSNGCENSMSNTQCAGHGAFGAFGKDNSFAGGASGDRTGYANSALCGSPSPNSSAATLGDHTN